MDHTLFSPAETEARLMTMLANTSGDQTRTIASALACVVMQKPEPPVEDDEAIMVKYKCSACANVIGYKSKIHADLVYRPQYCPCCGKKVLWE